MESDPHPNEEGQRSENAQHATAAQPQHQRPHKSHSSRRRKRIKILWLGALTVLALALLIWLPILLWGWRYVAEQWRRMRILLGEPTFLLMHLATYFSVAFGPWLLRKYKKEPETALKVLTVILVVVVLFVNTWNVTTATRHLVAQRAEEMCDESFMYTHSQLDASPRATSDLVILDQGISKGMSYLHLIVRNEFPEFDLRTASLHMVPSGSHSNEVWDIIQEGSQRKDREFMSYPTASDPSRTSLVGQAIKEGRVKYCRDIAHPEQGGDDCKTFQAPPSGEAEYRSLICFPIESVIGTPVFASICFDSKADHAFDKKVDKLRDRINKQAGQIGGLLQRYRDQDKFLFKDSQPEGQSAAR